MGENEVVIPRYECCLATGENDLAFGHVLKLEYGDYTISIHYDEETNSFSVFVFDIDTNDLIMFAVIKRLIHILDALRRCDKIKCVSLPTSDDIDNLISKRLGFANEHKRGVVVDGGLETIIDYKKLYKYIYTYLNTFKLVSRTDTMVIRFMEYLRKNDWYSKYIGVKVVMNHNRTDALSLFMDKLINDINNFLREFGGYTIITHNDIADIVIPGKGEIDSKVVGTYTSIEKD